MKNQALSKIWLVLIVVILIIGGGILISYWQKLNEEVTKTEEILEKNVEGTADWEVYQNEIFGYSFKYPIEEFEIEERKDIEEELITYIKAVPPDDIPGMKIQVVSLEKSDHLKNSIIWIYGSASKEPPTPIIDWETTTKNVELKEVLIGEDIDAIKLYNKNGIISWAYFWRYTFFFTKENKSFAITLIQPENYPIDYLPIFNQIISTFKITE